MRSRTPTGREKKKEKEAKASDTKIRRFRSNNATLPVHKLNFDSARPSALRSPHTTDVSDFAVTSDLDEGVGDDA